MIVLQAFAIPYIHLREILVMRGRGVGGWGGGELNKERVSVLVGCNMDVTEKLPVLVIRKAAKPRCFKHYQCYTITTNQSGWPALYLMNGFWKLITSFHSKKRKVLVLLGNCSSHDLVMNEQLQSTKLDMLTPNGTSK